MRWNDISRRLGEFEWKFWFILHYQNDIELAKRLFKHIQYTSQYSSIANCGAHNVLNMLEYSISMCYQSMAASNELIILLKTIFSNNHISICVRVTSSWSPNQNSNEMKFNHLIYYILFCVCINVSTKWQYHLWTLRYDWVGGSLKRIKKNFILFRCIRFSRWRKKKNNKNIESYHHLRWISIPSREWNEKK